MSQVAAVRWWARPKDSNPAPNPATVGQLNFRTKLLTGWSGYVSGGVKFNSDFTTTTAKGGIRYQW